MYITYFHFSKDLHDVNLDCVFIGPSQKEMVFKHCVWVNTVEAIFTQNATMVGLGPQDRTRVCELPLKANTETEEKSALSSKKLNVKISLNNSNIIDQGYVSTLV